MKFKPLSKVYLSWLLFVVSWPLLHLFCFRHWAFIHRIFPNEPYPLITQFPFYLGSSQRYSHLLAMFLYQITSFFLSGLHLQAASPGSFPQITNILSMLSILNHSHWLLHTLFQVSIFTATKLYNFWRHIICLFAMVSLDSNIMTHETHSVNICWINVWANLFDIEPFSFNDNPKKTVKSKIIQHLQVVVRIDSLLCSVSSVVQSCPTLHDPMNHSKPGLPVHHQLPEFTQTHLHQVGDAILPSHPLSSPSPAPNPSQHQSLFQ